MLICRVPSQEITQAPWDSLPVYVCPFAVRSPRALLRGFSWQHGITHFATRRSRHHASELNGTADLPTAPSYTLEPTLPIVGWTILLRHPIVQTRSEWYRNVRLFPIDYAFQPRLRGRLTLGKITFTLETLGFRLTGISPVFSLLMPAFSLPSPPACLTTHLHQYTECSPTPE